jgi:hypothetical protein
MRCKTPAGNKLTVIFSSHDDPCATELATEASVGDEPPKPVSWMPVPWSGAFGDVASFETVCLDGDASSTTANVKYDGDSKSADFVNAIHDILNAYASAEAASEAASPSGPRTTTGSD